MTGQEAADYWYSYYRYKMTLSEYFQYIINLSDNRGYLRGCVTGWNDGFNFSEGTKEKQEST